MTTLHIIQFNSIPTRYSYYYNYDDEGNKYDDLTGYDFLCDAFIRCKILNDRDLSKLDLTTIPENTYAIDVFNVTTRVKNLNKYPVEYYLCNIKSLYKHIYIGQKFTIKQARKSSFLPEDALDEIIEPSTLYLVRLICGVWISVCSKEDKVILHLGELHSLGVV